MKLFARVSVNVSSPSKSLGSRLLSRIQVVGIRLLGHASRAWPFIVLAIVLSLSWGALKQIRPHEFRTALHAINRTWLLVATGVTLANIAVMGLYDVIAFRHTRASWAERWRYGAVAFAWSNFLTLGPLAGPAIRFSLYRPVVEQLSELQDGVISVAIAFTAGLIGWTLAVMVAARTGTGPIVASLLAFILALGGVLIGRAIAIRTARFATPAYNRSAPAPLLAFVGWLDWLLAVLAFTACVRASGADPWTASVAKSFFLGQVVGLASFVPGGFGSSDLYWIAHLELARSPAAAALVAYRLVYYVIPWAAASLVLLACLTKRTPRRLEVAHRVMAGLVGGAGVLIILSGASPALHARMALLRQFIPLTLVAAGQVAAAFAGLVLLVLARGLARGYRAAFRATLSLLALASLAALLKGLDWEEAVVLAAVAAAAWSQGGLFDRRCRGDWLKGRDVALAFGALALFVTFGTISHRLSPVALERWMSIGHRFQATTFIRTAASMALAVAAGALYVLMRTPVGFRRLSDEHMTMALSMLARYGSGTNPLMVATGDKAVFFDGQRGFCLYRTIGPYLVVFSDPVVRSPAERNAFLDELFTFCAEIDRRPVLYQMSLDWLPALHDHGYDFFKLGEEAHVGLDRVTLDGHAGKMHRQVLARAKRDGVRFRILTPEQTAHRMAELKEISDDWLAAKGVVERQFSIGFFDEDYLRRYPCAIVEEAQERGRILAFANLLEGPDGEELSVDLMRYRTGGPSVMDFMIVSLLLNGKSSGYARFNLGVAPLAWVGEQQGAHLRERVVHFLFQRGERWYNFRGLRSFKQKFDPQWVPRYMAYQHGWEWPMAIAYVSALTAGGWSSVLLPGQRVKRTVRTPGQIVEA
jgi:phosphatidylglycerol lysyltransferase